MEFDTDAALYGENRNGNVHSERMSEKKSKLSTDYGTDISILKMLISYASLRSETKFVR